MAGRRPVAAKRMAIPLRLLASHCLLFVAAAAAAPTRACHSATRVRMRGGGIPAWCLPSSLLSCCGLRSRNEPKRVLMLMSETGGGHLASAKAIEAALAQQYPGRFSCRTVDVWTELGSWPFSDFVSQYQWAAQRPWAWRLVYYLTQTGPTRWLHEAAARLRCQTRITDFVQEYDPDVVVSVHPLCQDIPLKSLEQIGGGKRQVPFVTVVTDLGGAHNQWFHSDVDMCCVPSEAVRKLALRNGVPKDKVVIHGLPVRKGFWGAGGRKERSGGVRNLREKLGLENVPTVLLLGGGDGVGKLQHIAVCLGSGLGEEDGRCQMVVICGKNHKVRAALSKTKWPANVAVRVMGFVANVDDLMVASDCVVTKAGPGTIAEASIVGLPIILSGFLPGQEAGNVQYVVDQGIGFFEPNARRLAERVRNVLKDGALLKEMARKAISIGAAHSKASLAIARDIASLVID